MGDGIPPLRNRPQREYPRPGGGHAVTAEDVNRAMRGGGDEALDNKRPPQVTVESLRRALQGSPKKDSFGHASQPGPLPLDGRDPKSEPQGPQRAPSILDSQR
jgi:hypothetical protein